MTRCAAVAQPASCSSQGSKCQAEDALDHCGMVGLACACFIEGFGQWCHSTAMAVGEATKIAWPPIPASRILLDIALLTA